MLSAPPAQEHPPMILGIDLTASERKPTACATKPNHDLHDALIAAYTGYLHTQGATDLAGVALEGQIALPKS